MIFKIEIECPYCGKKHVHSLDIGIPENTSLEGLEKEEEKHHDECGPEES